MHVPVATLLALQCSLCLSIRVPVVWNNDNSEVNKFAVETVPPQNAAASQNSQKPIPNEYFQYTAQKPKFAVDIAQFHGVQSPQNHYKAYPIKPQTGVAKPELGKHQLLDKENNNFLPYQEYVKKNEAVRHVTPSTTSYEIFHPYKLEEAALKELYQDPVMDKIRNDLLNSKNRLQKYENEAGEPDITKAEYLESPEETDRKKVPQKNIPAPYEIHRPQRRPVYYRHPAPHNHRENILNQKLRHPWHQNYVKIKPVHYRPVKNNLHRLRQQHAMKYDDEKNEYPQVLPPEKYSEPSDGYDIYEKGKEKFVQLRNNVDESINEAVQKNRPIVNHKLELTNDQSNENTAEDDEDEEDNFVPIKNYAQVRKTETTKHLPKEAAYYDADTLEEIQNAPRLREAVKSTKAQTVYSEEGYEDSAYDHAGEQKHASDHEAHGGFLKEKENSGGKFKIPSFSAKFEDGKGSEYRDQVLDGKKWKNNNKDTEKETELDEYSEEDKEHSDESDTFSHELTNSNIKEGDKIIDRSLNEDNERIKREKIVSETSDAEKSTETSDKDTEHDVNKRETNIEVPEIDIDKTYLNDKDILNLPKLKVEPKTDTIGEKYPYYFKKLKAISPHSPLRYAENLKLIPKKSEGGTEFYDSRSKYECPEVEDDIDPLPEKLKKDGHPDDDEENTEDIKKDKVKKDKSDFSALEKNPRLRGLGDKIDCFKAKYFGENPLDSPFFKEEIIANPEPVTVPSIDIYKLKQKKELSTPESNLNEALDVSKDLQEKGKIDMFTLLDKLYPKPVYELPIIKKEGSNTSPILKETKSTEVKPNPLNSETVLESQNSNDTPKEDVTNLPTISRKKRAAPFVYEPYKIIRDSQIQDSKKTTTTNNISPLIKQLQSSRVATNQGKEQVVKRNVSTRTYKDIGKSDREKNAAKEKGSKPISDTSFVDVSVDQRRGEPRYELRPVNHKSHYTPVENKKSITKEEYKAHTKSDMNSEDDDLIDNKRKENHEQRVTTARPFFDVTKYLPSTEEFGKNDRSSRKSEKEKSKVPQSRSDKSVEDSESEEDDEEYDGNNDNERRKITTTKSPSRKRIATSPTTSKPKKEDDEDLDELPKLRLITRFHDSYETEKPTTAPVHKETPTTKVHNSDAEINGPKYREKKKKSRKSTLVTDTKSYGEDDDDDDDDEDNLRKEEVDALIGVKHDDKEYIPKYGHESQRREGPSNSRSKNVEDDYEEKHRYHEDDDEDEDEDDEDEDDDDDDDDEDDEEDENEDAESEVESKPELTTPEPTKRTLVRTTEAPPVTTESQSARLEVKPVVVKKKFESHKELPVNRSSPHITEFKQDIKEVEIIKELPIKTKKKPQKNIEALELYKDENLAKDVNKLGGVEIFKEGLDLVNGPKHGGNYRMAEELTDSAAWPSSRRDNKKSAAPDAMTSQSTSKLVEVKDDRYSRRRSDIERARKNRGRSAKLIELSDSTETPPSRPMHGGNFKSIHEVRRGGRRGGSRNAKIVELDEHKSRNDQSTNTHGSNSRSYGSRGGDRHQMHGGNYRSAKIVQADSKGKEPTITESTTKKDTSIDGNRNAAVILNTFASAIPVLETTPAYILDPSKRMYYYVDA